MADNIQIKDALGNEFTLRAKDISAAGDGSLQRSMNLATLYPIDYGAGGMYQLTSKSGVMGAGLAAASPIYSFRWTQSPLMAVVRRVQFTMWSLGTAFTAGIGTYDLYFARSFTLSDTGGVTDTITGNNGKLRTSMATTGLPEIRHSSTATLTAGTRTLDAQPVDSVNSTVNTGQFTVMQPRVSLFQKLQGEHPMVLGLNEGFVIQVTVPATGTWSFAVSTEWDEVTSY